MKDHQIMNRWKEHFKTSKLKQTTGERKTRNINSNSSKFNRKGPGEVITQDRQKLKYEDQQGTWKQEQLLKIVDRTNSLEITKKQGYS